MVFLYAAHDLVDVLLRGRRHHACLGLPELERPDAVRGHPSVADGEGARQAYDVTSLSLHVIYLFQIMVTDHKVSSPMCISDVYIESLQVGDRSNKWADLIVVMGLLHGLAGENPIQNPTGISGDHVLPPMVKGTSPYREGG